MVVQVPLSVQPCHQILVILIPNQTLSLDSGTSILKERILAMPQLTLTTSNSSSLINNLWPLYKLLSFSFLLFVQLQLLILTPFTETFFWPFLVIQLLQNTSLEIADGLQTPTVFFISMTKSMYYLLVIFTHTFSSIILIIFFLATSVKTKH